MQLNLEIDGKNIFDPENADLLDAFSQFTKDVFAKETLNFLIFLNKVDIDRMSQQEKKDMTTNYIEKNEINVEAKLDSQLKKALNSSNNTDIAESLTAASVEVLKLVKTNQAKNFIKSPAFEEFKQNKIELEAKKESLLKAIDRANNLQQSVQTWSNRLGSYFGDLIGGKASITKEINHIQELLTDDFLKSIKSDEKTIQLISKLPMIIHNNQYNTLKTQEKTSVIPPKTISIQSQMPPTQSSIPKPMPEPEKQGEIHAQKRKP